MSLLAIPSGTSSNAGGFYPYAIDGSLRFNDDDSAYLSWTPASAGDRKTWTWSAWIKRSGLGTYQRPFQASIDANNRTELTFFPDNTLEFFTTIGGVPKASLKTQAVFRDPSAWYHLVVVLDAVNTSLEIYVNGVLQTLTTTTAVVNTDHMVSSTNVHTLGRYNPTGASYFDGYMAEVHFIDGQALDADDFGETISGVWVPKAYSGSYGTNGFYLEFAGNANDSSGNGNNWTENNITSDDYVSDSPTDNFATMNPLDIQDPTASITFAEGNLKVTSTSNSTSSTITMKSGYWYAEVTKNADGDNQIGIVSNSVTQGFGTNTFRRAWRDDNGSPKFLTDDGTAGSGTAQSLAAGDVLGIAVDLENNAVYFAKNNTWMNSGDPTSGASKTGAIWTDLNLHDQWFFYCGSNANSLNCTWNFGQQDFDYTPPTGYLALSTANLPDPAIDPAQGSSPEDYFNTALYTGASALTVDTGLPSVDMVWIKSRSAGNFHRIIDVLRGDDTGVYPNSDAAEATYSANDDCELNTPSSGNIYLDSTNGGTNQSGATHVAWAWRANGSGVSNTDGSITSTVSANTESGFSIVSYTGNGSAGATVGHGLSSVPEMIIVKNRDATDAWQVYHASNTANPETDYLVLNTTAATADNLDRWNDTAPTTSVFSLGDGVEVNTNTEDYIAYCFHSVEGFSKFGSYTGNGNADGPFVYTGFRPAFVMIKNASLGATHWLIWDEKRSVYNVTNDVLRPAIANAESVDNSSYAIDMLSNGFKARSSYGDVNQSGNTIIYMAFAENPFKYSNAR